MKKTIILFTLLGLMLSCAKKTVVSRDADTAPDKNNVSTKDYAEPPHIELVNPRWVLRELGTSPIKPLGSQGDLYVRFKDASSLEGFAGCNSISGSYSSKQSALKIGPLVSTRMTCQDQDLETSFLKVLEQTESYYTDSKYLYLESKGKVIAKLEAVYL